MIPSSYLAALFVGSYLFGGVPFGWLVARLHGVDVRKAGSGNVGATNVGRVLGRKWGILVFLLDVGKGAAVVVGTRWLLTRAGYWPSAAPTVRDWVWLGAGLCCVIGNVASVFLRFRGGKGVATSLGVILGIYPYLTWPGLLALACWGIVVKLSGYVSLGSIAAAAVLPGAFWTISTFSDWTVSEHYPLFALCVAMTVVVLIRHRANIGRLWVGTENKLG